MEFGFGRFLIVREPSKRANHDASKLDHKRKCGATFPGTAIWMLACWLAGSLRRRMYTWENNLEMELS